MVRFLALALASLAYMASSPLVSAYTTFNLHTYALIKQITAANGSDDSVSCGNYSIVANTIEITQPSDQVIDGSTLVINVTATDLASSAEVVFTACNSSSETKTVEAGVKKTWLTTLSGQCVSFKQDTSKSPLDCTNHHVTVEVSLLTDYCERSKKSSLCGGSGSGTNSESSTSKSTSAAASMTTTTPLAWTFAASVIATVVSVL